MAPSELRRHDHGFASPSRRDYQLRSGSEDASRPQSPWLPTMAASRRQFSQSSSFAGRLPDAAENRARRTRKCVSGELGRTFEAPVKARGCKSGEIVGLEIRADGIFPIPESSSSSRKLPAPVHMHRPSGSILWETLNDADNIPESPRRELAIVPVPFKWEEATRSSSAGEPGEVSLAVPFKWEVTPGKPRKVQDENAVSSLPPLQLPPRLASAPSMKHRSSWSPCSASRYRLEEPPSRFRLEEPTSRHRTISISEEPASPSRGQFGVPQYQSDCCYEDRVRSPTSTLCGPGTPSSSSSASSSSYSRKPSSVSYSLESFDRWDHASPTSRHSYAESQDSNPPSEPDGGAIVKLRRKFNLSSKPPRSPNMRAHVEEYYDCQQTLAASSPLRMPVEEEEEPATRLPYKMPPSSPAREVEPPSSSSTREFSHCLALPRFLSRSDCAITQWVDTTRNPQPASSVEDGYRSPAYKATLDLLSPSPDLLSKKSASKLRSPSTRRRHSHLVEVLCNSLKQSLQRYTKRSVVKTQSIVLYDDTFTKRHHQSFMW